MMWNKYCEERKRNYEERERNYEERERNYEERERKRNRCIGNIFFSFGFCFFLLSILSVSSQNSQTGPFDYK